MFGIILFVWIAGALILSWRETNDGISYSGSAADSFVDIVVLVMWPLALLLVVALNILVYWDIIWARIRRVKLQK